MRVGGERRSIMHRPVRFSDDIEPLVQFIEETDSSRILEATLAKLRECQARRGYGRASG